MHKNTWKQGERRVAKFFGTKRTPLSGGNSGITRSDSLHDRLFIEAKHGKRHAVRTLYDDTAVLAKEEGKIPVLALLTTGRPGFLVCIHSKDLDAFCKERMVSRPDNPLGRAKHHTGQSGASEGKEGDS